MPETTTYEYPKIMFEAQEIVVIANESLQRQEDMCDQADALLGRVIEATFGNTAELPESFYEDFYAEYERREAKKKLAVAA